MAPSETAPGDGSPDPRVGTVVAGKYTLLRRLGEGGMAAVYLSRQNEIGKELALKILDPAFAGDEEYRERFLREAKASSRIAHDNVVDVTDFGETPDGSVFIAMELLKGESLAETIARDAPLSILRTKRIGLQVCRALHAAHDNGVLHRDVKPENIQRMKRGANKDFIKVLDFGIAKVGRREDSDSITSLTEAGQVFGTPEYMSPEQATGAQCSPRSDVYALGIVLYEMATGRVPFSSGNVVAIMSAHLHRPVLPPSSVDGARVTPELETVIVKALEKDPQDRYLSMRDFAEALAAVEDPEHSSVGTAPSVSLSRSHSLTAPTPVEPTMIPSPAPEPAVEDGSATRERAYLKMIVALVAVIGVLVVALTVVLMR